MAQPAAAKPAYILLLSVIILGAVSLAVALTLLLLSISTGRSSSSLEQGTKARYLANACAEEGLQQIRVLKTYTGTTNLVYADGTCFYTVINTGGNTRQIQAAGTVNNHIQRMIINLNGLTPVLTVVSWQEVASF
ncbi:MAG TPA: hypothetical protein PKI61_02280 [bacterium]|nr:hypothetical protein [bacterium]HPT30006.1 hypothetical protein [bacterium]